MKTSILSVLLLMLGCTACKKSEPVADKPASQPSVPDSSCSITSFLFNAFNPSIRGTIKDDSILIGFPPGTDPAGQIPAITVSGKATVSPGSGVAQDFSQAIAYTVTAENKISQKTYYARASHHASPKDVPVPPKALCLYYGWPSLVNGSNGDVNAAVSVFAQFDRVVFGDGIWQASHGDHAKTVQIISSLKAAKPDIRIFGYIDVGVTTQNLSVAQLQAAIDGWKAMGVTGVFGDDFDYQHGVTRSRQNDFIDYAHGRSLHVFVNAWHIDDAMGNYANAESHLEENDCCLLESMLIGNGVYESLDEFKSRADAAYYYMRSRGVSIAALTTLAPGSLSAASYTTDNFSFGWCAAAMYNFDAFQFTEGNHSATSNQVYYYPGLSAAYGQSWKQYDWVSELSPTQFSRSTDVKTLMIKGDGSTYGKGTITP